MACRTTIRCSVIDSSTFVVGRHRATVIRWRQPPAMEKPGKVQKIGPTWCDGSHSDSGASTTSSMVRSAKPSRSCGPKPSNTIVFPWLTVKTVLGWVAAKW